MRLCASPVGRYVIDFTVPLLSVFVLTACGSGTESDHSGDEFSSSARVPTSQLTDALVLSANSLAAGQSIAHETSLAAVDESVDVDPASSEEIGVELNNTADAAAVQLGFAMPGESTNVNNTAGTEEPTGIESDSTSVVPTSESTTAEFVDVADVKTDQSAEGSGVEYAPESDTAPEPKAETAPESIPESAPESIPEATPESIPEATPEPTPETVTEPEPAAPTSALPSPQFDLGTDVGDVVKLITNLPTSVAQTNVQQTPVAVADGYLYTANIEHGPRGDVSGYDLKTVVRQGRQATNGSWTWESTVVEDRTIHDKWHTAPSVEVDKNGHVHVVYNLHNFPWQYKRTALPHNLQSFEFLGQAVTNEQIRQSVEENRTSFPTLGKADIPGNQVTYPAFFKDRNSDLYVSYRFGATPRQSFSNRTMSAGVSVYNAVTQTWEAIGGQLSLTSSDYEAHPDAGNSSVAIAAKQGWTAYHPRLVFDQDNKMYVNWFWRLGTAGAMLTHPCLVSTTDRFTFKDSSDNAVSMPMEPTQCGNLGYPNSQEFYSVGNTAISNSGDVHIILSPDTGSRKIVYYDSTTSEWRREDAPYNATEIFFDGEDNLWAIASGIRLYKRVRGSTHWQTVYDDSASNNCYPKVTQTEDHHFAFIHAEACSGGSVTVFGVRLQ